MSSARQDGRAVWSRLEAAHYTDARVLAGEREYVFADAWQPVGLAEHLQNDRDYICAHVAGRSVVIQNFAGSLRAFENVCSHRQSPLRLCPRGNGPLQCPYHGWSFDESGRPSGIPQRRSFGPLSDGLLQQLTLESWAVELIGPLVFVARRPASSAAASMGTLASELTSLFTGAQRCLQQHSFELVCNWKVMLENGLDAYHVPLVHPKSLHKHGLHERAREQHGAHSVGRFGAESAGRVVAALRYAFPGARITTEYAHYLLFPNVYVVSVYGLFLVVSRIDPSDAERASFESFVFVSWDGTEGNVTLREELNASNAAFFCTGYLEDKEICEHVQQSLRVTTRRALLGLEEERIPMFHDAWLERMLPHLPSDLAPGQST